MAIIYKTKCDCNIKSHSETKIDSLVDNNRKFPVKKNAVEFKTIEAEWKDVQSYAWSKKKRLRLLNFLFVSREIKSGT